MNACIAKSNVFLTSSVVIPTSNCPRSTFAKPFRRQPLIRRLGCINSHTNTSGWIAPLEPRTQAGMQLLHDAFFDDEDSFQGKARKQLLQLAADRNEDEARIGAKLGVDDDSLYRRIVEVKNLERQQVVEDIMYTLIVHKFSKINVPLIPQLSKCPFQNNNVQVLTDQESDLELLKSVYPSDEVFEAATNKLQNFLSKLKSQFAEGSSSTEMQALQLHMWYAASLTYGYFLKSCIRRYQLESSYLEGNYGVNLRDYLTEFVWGVLRHMIEDLRSDEAVDVGTMHSHALFGDVWSGGEDQMISVSYESVVSLVREGLAFGSFLWEAERWIDDFYPLYQI